MKNSCRTRMLAWIMATIMVLCLVPITSTAGIVEPLEDEYSDEFILNKFADCFETYVDENGKSYSDPPAVGQGKEYTLTLNVSEATEKAEFISEGEMIYYLSDKVGTVTEISATGADAELSGKVIKFTLKDKDQKNFSARITFTTATDVYDLYNIAKIDKLYYRLAKTTITTEKVLSQNLGKQLADKDYTIKPYDFENLVITVKGKSYVYNSPANAEKIKAEGNRYYTAEFYNIDAVSQKIGGMDDKNNPRWLVPEEQRYNDPNKTDSYHANYNITLHEDPYEQDLYNMLQVNDSNDYYRLRKTRIIAIDPAGLNDNEVPKTYVLVPNEAYDFTNVTIEKDGEIYEYSDKVLTGEYYSYYTVKLDKIWKKSRTNGNAAWYNNDEGFLDGSKEQYLSEPNDVTSYHRDYKAKLYKGTKERPPKVEKSVTITSDWPEGKPAFIGTLITLTAHPVGFDGTDYDIQWQRSTDPDSEIWENVSGANEITYTYELSGETVQYYWRVVVTDDEDL